MDIAFHTPVMTKDGEQLGLAQRIYHSTNPEIEVSRFHNHLMVFDFSTGDSLYVPLDFVSAEGETVQLSLEYQEILNRSYSNMPRYVAYDDYNTTELAKS